MATKVLVVDSSDGTTREVNVEDIVVTADRPDPQLTAETVHGILGEISKTDSYNSGRPAGRYKFSKGPQEPHPVMRPAAIRRRENRQKRRERNAGRKG